MEEIWKDVIGFEGLYQVSNLGKVKSLARVIIRSNGRTQALKEKILSPRPCKKGYSRAVINFYMNRTDLKIHRLVATAFIPNPKNLKEVNHKNGIKSDNRVENLEWCTRSENVKHSFDNGLRFAFIGENNKSSKLTEDQVLEIKKTYPLLNQYQLAKKFNISRSVIASILKGRTWKHVK